MFTQLGIVSELAFSLQMLFVLNQISRYFSTSLEQKPELLNVLRDHGFLSTKFSAFLNFLLYFNILSETVCFIHIIAKFKVFIQNRAGSLGKFVQFIHYFRAGSPVHILDPGLSDLFLKISTNQEFIAFPAVYFNPFLYLLLESKSSN